jgi:hypothetical protein
MAEQSTYYDPPAADKADSLAAPNANTRVAGGFDAVATSPLKPQSALAQPDQADIGRMESGIATAQKPYLDKLKSVLDSPQAAHAQLEKIKKEPNPEDYHKYSMEFASAAAVLGAIAGKFTRAGGTAALNAFTGAMKGWQSGNLQAYEEASKQWEQESKRTIQNNNVELEKYHEILNDKKANIEQMMAGLSIASTEYQNKVVFDLAKSGNFNGVAQAVDKMGMANQRLQGAVGQLTGLREDQIEDAKSKVDYFIKNPDQLGQLPMKDYLAVRSIADRHPEWGQLPDRPAAGTNIQSAVDAVGQYKANPATALSRMPPGDREAFWKQLDAQYPDWSQQNYNAQSAGATTESRIAKARIAKVDYAVNLLDENIDAAADAARAFPMGKFVPFDAAKLWAAHQGSDVRLSQWDVVNLQILENYATLLNPNAQTIRKDMFDKAAGPLSQAKSTEAYLATLDAIRAAGQREKEAGRQTIVEQRGGAPKVRTPVSGGSGAGDIPPPPPGFN